MQFVPQHDRSRRHGLHQGSHWIHVLVRHLVAASNQDDRALLLRPHQALLQAWKKMPHSDDAGTGELLDVRFRHVLRGIVFVVPVAQLLSLRQDDQVETQLQRRFAHLLAELRHCQLELFPFAAEDFARLAVMPFEHGQGRDE